MEEPDALQLQMMAFLDDELSDEERRAFIEQCYADPALAEELARYRRLHDIASSMQLREPEDYEYERFFARVTSRIERRLGFVLFAAGLAVVFVAAMHAMITSGCPTTIKVGTVLTLLGLFVLAFSVCRLRLRIARLDRYQGVKR